MFKSISISLIILGGLALGAAIAQDVPTPIVNPQIDSETFLEHVAASHERRRHRRLTEAEFIEMAQTPGTLVLDARSAQRFEQMHIQGAKSLSFTDFTAETLAAIIPSKQTRILIYCNNNIVETPSDDATGSLTSIAFPTKIAPASLNLSTYTALYSYGYQNVYELGPIINPQSSNLKFAGSILHSSP